MEFRILGPLEVVEDGHSLAVPSGHQRALLALLLVNANRVLTPDRIADELWGDDLPATGTKALAFHVSRLRDALAPGRGRGDSAGGLETEPGGYILRVDPEAIDAVRFERLVGRAHAGLAEDPAVARDLLVEALALWRGDPLVDVAYATFAQAEIRRLDELRLGATEDRLEAELALGLHLGAIAELEGLVRANPLRDRLRGLLMLALYRAGRQAEALRVAGDGRRMLAEELGVDPSPELVRLEAMILTQDPQLEPRAAAALVERAARNPFKGLRPFGEADAGDFHGREALVGRLLGRLEDVLHDGRLLLVVGPSGSGKSSVVRAGLVPALRAGAVEGSDRWCIATMAPGNAPVRQLAAALRSAGALPSAGQVERAATTGELLPLFGAALAGGAPRLLLVIDQFEELYTRVDEASRERFLDALLGALGAPDGQVVIVATLRADFFHLPLGSPNLGDLVRRGVEVVTPLSRAELERAIVRPADGVGVVVEPGLATEIAGDVERQSGALPLVQFALTDLFDRSDGHVLTRDGYAAIGGAVAALGRRADEAWQSLDDEGREVARQVLLRLVVVAEGSEVAACRVARDELRSLGAPGFVDAVLDDLGERRLLTFDREPTTGEPTVEVAHEALLVHWPRLAAWIDDQRRDLWMRRRLGDAAAEWEAAGRAPGFLAAGARLDQMASWAEATRLRLNDGERTYLHASLAERVRLERRARTARLGLVGLLATGLVVAVGLSALLLGQWRAGVEREEIAAAREYAAGSIASLGDRQLSVLLALEAANATVDRGYVVEEAYDALHWALQEAQVAYPAEAGAFTVRQGPEGPRGEPLLAPEVLMRMAAAYTQRTLTPEECRLYLHVVDCPAVLPPPAGGTHLALRAAAGIVPVEDLAVESIAGTRVRVLSELPGDLGPLLAGLEQASGIELAWDPLAGGDLRAHLAGGRLPDVAIVSQPAEVSAAARDGSLLDVDGVVDTSALRREAGEYLVGLGTAAGADGSPGLYGAPIAATVDDLLWYPSAAFAAAGYEPPSTPGQLASLVATIRRDGRIPWCLGTEAGSQTGSAAARWVEDDLLEVAGQDTYDRWVTGNLPFDSPEVRAAITSFGGLALADGAVLDGYAAVGRTPEAIAGLGMLLDPPRCWLYRGTSTDRSRLKGKGLATPAAVPYPGSGPAASPVLGRLYLVVVLHDRPEVRRVVESLLGAPLAASIAAELGTGGVFPVRVAGPPADRAAGSQASRLRAAVDEGTFRVRATDLFPAEISAAFLKGVEGYVDGYGDRGPSRLDVAVWAGDGAWAQVRREGQ